MSERRQELRALLERHYASHGWRNAPAADGTVRAVGIGGVTWIGLPVVPEDLEDPRFAERLRALGNERMPTGELCPLELLPDEACNAHLRALLDELRLRDRGNVEVYSLAA